MAIDQRLRIAELELLRCGRCGSSYAIAGANRYGCSGHRLSGSVSGASASSVCRTRSTPAPGLGRCSKVLSILPRAAQEYRRQLAQGLVGDPRAALKARVFLREWFGGKIRLEPLPDGGLMALWNENAAALLRTAALGVLPAA